MAGIGIIICLATCAVLVIALVILIASSLSSLEVNEYGLDYSGITKTIDVQIYGAGIHFLGVAHSFIRFPSTVQTYEFSNQRGSDEAAIQSRSQDGLEVTLEVSFQYKWVSNDLIKLYLKYGPNFSRPCKQVAIDILTDIATNYKAS